jgi:peroxiredoxin
MTALFLHYELLDPLGKPTFLDDVLGGRPTLLCFLRHFGCLFCFEHASSVLEEKAHLERGGAQLVFVGNGNPAHAREFMQEYELTRGGVFTDPSRRLYSALEMHHGVSRTLNVQTARHARRAYSRGHRQRGVKGDPWQQGGNVAIAANGNILASERASVAGDLVPVRELVRLLVG